MHVRHLNSIASLGDCKYKIEPLWKDTCVASVSFNSAAGLHLSKVIILQTVSFWSRAEQWGFCKSPREDCRLTGISTGPQGTPYSPLKKL